MVPVSPGPRWSRSRPTASGTDLALRLSRCQRLELRQWQGEVASAGGWSGDLPVALLEPSWLRLRRLPVQRLATELPPDGSEEAPELVRYRQLRAAGLDDWSVQLQCWQEFGSEAFQRAQHLYWERQDRGNHGWTLDRYLALLAEYRRSLAAGGPRRLPLLVLAPPDGPEDHQLMWLPGAAR
jgi:hypothetical protein